MAKRDPGKEMLDQVAACANGAITDEAIGLFKKAIASRYFTAAARAVRAVEEHSIAELAPEIRKNFPRFMKNLPKSDPGCKVKIAMVKALDKLEESCEKICERSIRHAQMEGTFGPPIDTAAALRGAALCAMVNMRHPEALHEIPLMLFDKWPEARSGAVRAAAGYNGSEGEALLRAKVMAGDKDPDIMGECFSSLIRIAPEASIPFVAGFLKNDDPPIVEMAALALGESRNEAVLGPLEEVWAGSHDDEMKHIIIQAVAMLRSEKALEFLAEIVESDYEHISESALKTALLHYRDDKSVGIISEAVDDSESPVLKSIFERER